MTRSASKPGAVFLQERAGRVGACDAGVGGNDDARLDGGGEDGGVQVGAGRGMDLTPRFGDRGAPAVNVDGAAGRHESRGSDALEGTEVAQDGLGEGMDVDAGAVAAGGVVAFMDADCPATADEGDGGCEACKTGTSDLGVAVHECWGR